MNCNDFYLRRDLRTCYYINGASVEPQPLQIYWGEDAAGSPTGQMILLSLGNQLARFCRRAGFSGPDAPLLVPAPFGGISLHDALVTACGKIDPCGRWMIGEIGQPVYRIGVGQQCQTADLFLGADGWLAYAVSQMADLLPFTNEDNLLGAGMAACMGAANAFKVCLNLPQPLISGAFSLWSFTRDGQALQGVPLVEIDLGRVLMVGAGAVATSLVYWQNYLPIMGQWDVVDHDEVQLDNTNRGLLFTAGDAGWLSNECQKKARILARYLNNAIPYDCWFDEFDTSGKRWDLILPLANERGVRGLLQAYRPPFMVHATTSPNWQVQLHRHRPGHDRCLICRLPERDLPPPACAAVPLGRPDSGQDHPPDAALPFLSATAGLLLAADLLRLGLAGYEKEPGNLFTLDMFADMGRPTVRHEECQSGCSGWGHPTVRHSLNSTTRWYHMDRDS